MNSNEARKNRRYEKKVNKTRKRIRKRDRDRDRERWKMLNKNTWKERERTVKNAEDENDGKWLKGKKEKYNKKNKK